MILLYAALLYCCVLSINDDDDHVKFIASFQSLKLLFCGFILLRDFEILLH